MPLGGYSVAVKNVNHSNTSLHIAVIIFMLPLYCEFCQTWQCILKAKGLDPLGQCLGKYLYKKWYCDHSCSSRTCHIINYQKGVVTYCWSSLIHLLGICLIKGSKTNGP